MFIIPLTSFIKICQYYEDSKYSDIIITYESLNIKYYSFTTHEQLIASLYYIQSLIKTTNIKKALQITSKLQNDYSDSKLNLIDRLIFYTINILSFCSSGDMKETLVWYNKSKEFVNREYNSILRAKENYWIHFYYIIVATYEIKLRNYSIAYDFLKQANNHLSPISDLSRLEMILLSWINILFGQMHKQNNYLSIAVNNFEKAIGWGLKAKNIEYTRSSYLYLALVYEEQRKEYLAIKEVKNLILEIKNSFNYDEYSLSSAYNLLGNIYNRMGEFELAKDNYLTAYSVSMDSELIGQIKSFHLNNMGVISYKMGDYEKALEYYLEALKIAKSKEDTKELAYYYSNIGEVFLVLNQLDNALHYELQAKNSLNSFKNDDLLAEVYFILNRIYLEKDDYEKSDYYIEEIKKLSLKIKKVSFEHKFILSKAIKAKKQQNSEYARVLFLEVLGNNNASYDSKIIALTELAEIMLNSILKVKNDDYSELELIVNKLMLLGKEKNSLPIFCNLAIFLSRIKIKVSDFGSAENILNEALSKCLEKNVVYLEEKIQHELSFCIEIKNLSILQTQNKNDLFIEKINSIEIMDYVRNIQRFMLSI